MGVHFLRDIPRGREGITAQGRYHLLCINASVVPGCMNRGTIEHIDVYLC